MNGKTVVIPWCCPRCRKQLSCDSLKEGLLCPRCEHLFPIKDGIPDFIGGNSSAFYEEKGEVYHFPKHVRSSYPLKTRLAMFFSDDDFSTNLNFLQQVMRHPGVVLDVGCGGGNTFYTFIGPTVGVDLAFSSLRRAQTIYPQVARALAEALPFPDNAFDYVVSTDVLEHLPLAIKDKALAEMARVLKPGGRMVHIFPVDNRHFLMRWAKRFPDLFQRYFIDLDGHDGFEMASAVLKRFQQFGLRLVRLSIQKGVIWSKWEILKRFDNEYRQTAPWLDGLVRLARLMGRNKWTSHAVNPILWMLDRLLTPWFDIDYAYRVGVCLEKPR
ncbi:MAG: methyltransferase domain-containing protein [Thermofilaceae archaeon]